MQEIIVKEEEIVAALQNFGLSEYESRAYMTLVRIGPSRAGKIAHAANVPQAKIYNTLDGLADMNMIEILVDAPKQYRAKPPEIAVRNLIFEREQSLQTLKKAAGEVVKHLKATKEQVLHGVWSTESKHWAEFFDRMADMASRAEKNFWGVTKNFTRSPKLTESIKVAHKRGVKIRVIGLTAPNEENYLRIKWLQQAGAEIRVFEAKVHPRICLTDGKEVLLRLDHDPNRREGFRFSSIFSQDVSLVKVFDAYLRSIWNKAVPVDLMKIENI